eukprot:1151275-Pelagomonas_calceolata.AAC.10
MGIGRECKLLSELRAPSSKKDPVHLLKAGCKIRFHDQFADHVLSLASLSNWKFRSKLEPAAQSLPDPRHLSCECDTSLPQDLTLAT